MAFDGSSDDRDDDDNDIWMITEMKIIAKISTRIMKYEPLDTQKIVSYKLKFLRSYKKRIIQNELKMFFNCWCLNTKRKDTGISSTKMIKINTSTCRPNSADLLKNRIIS